MQKQRQIPPEHFNETYEFYLDCHLTSSGNSGSGTEPPQQWERIEYENGKTRFNPCSHVKYIFTPFGPRSPIFRFHVDPSCKYQQWFNTFWNDGVIGPEGVLTPPGPLLGVNQFMLRALQNIRPKFKADVSVPNFLFELKDLKRIIPSRARLEGLLESLTDFTRKNSNKNPFQKVKNFSDKGSKEIANQYLSAQFGYLPLISDIGKLQSIFSKFNSQLDLLRSRAGVPNTGHYKEVAPGAEVLVDNIDPNYYSVQSYILTYSQVEYVLTLKYGYRILMEKLHLPAVFAKYIGFRDNPRIIWDAIPFSFIIDWFLRVGKALESFDDGALPVELRILDACISKRYSAVCKHYVRDVPNATGTVGYGSSTLVSQEGWVVYDRSRVDTLFFDSGLPPLPVADKISVKEFTLALALGRTMGR